MGQTDGLTELLSYRLTKLRTDPDSRDADASKNCQRDLC